MFGYRKGNCFYFSPMQDHGGNSGYCGKEDLFFHNPPELPKKGFRSKKGTLEVKPNYRKFKHGKNY